MIKFYYLPDCGPCEATKPLAITAAERTGKDILFINAQTRSPEDLAAEGVTIAPTICNGQRKIKGEQSLDRLLRFFGEAA
ncbi:thioredoxin domain-containing protein [Streptomyces sp. NPDC048057]|uniref:thioredoxin domain-containing protein n=1 Tax=Streptomyces sp. NPDC048057 TaxID=3155628 RepID=UPI00340D2B0D